MAKDKQAEAAKSKIEEAVNATLEYLSKLLQKAKTPVNKGV